MSPMFTVIIILLVVIHCDHHLILAACLYVSPRSVGSLTRLVNAGLLIID